MDLVIDERLAGFICSLPKRENAECGRVMDLLSEFGANLRMPYCKKIRTKLWELRVKGKTEIRILYGITKRKAYLVHGFIKKSNKTPDKEINTAINRLRLK